MTSDDGRKPEGAPERSPKADVRPPWGIDGNGPKRFSVQRKMAIVARLLRGEPLELVAREELLQHGVDLRHPQAVCGFEPAVARQDGAGLVDQDRVLRGSVRAQHAPAECLVL